MSILDINSICPGEINDVQSMILGRIALIGKGELSKGDGKDVDLYALEQGNWVMIPKEQYQIPGMVYFYNIDTTGLSLTETFVMQDDGSSEFVCRYNRNKGAMTMDIEGRLGGTQLSASLQLAAPDDRPKEIERMSLNSSYRKVDPRKLLQM